MAFVYLLFGHSLPPRNLLFGYRRNLGGNESTNEEEVEEHHRGSVVAFDMNLKLQVGPGSREQALTIHHFTNKKPDVRNIRVTELGLICSVSL